MSDHADKDVEPAKAAPANDNDHKPAQGQAQEPKGADSSKPKNDGSWQGKSTPLTVTGRYENLPGTTKDGPKAATAHTGLWFNPLTIASGSPHPKRAVSSVGLTKGGGQTVATFDAPQFDNGRGAGELTVQMMYATDVRYGVSVAISGKFKPADKTAAQQLIAGWLESEMRDTGELTSIQADAVAKIKDRFGDVDGLAVTISPINDSKQLADAGHTTVFYLARNSPVIELNVPVHTVAQQKVKSGGSQTKTEGKSDESNVHGEIKTDTSDAHKTQTGDATNHQDSKQTLDEHIHTESSKMFDETVSKLATESSTRARTMIDKVWQDRNRDASDNLVDTREEHKVGGYKNHATDNTDTGDRIDENWASYVQKLIKSAQGGLDLPIWKVAGPEALLEKWEIGLWLEGGDKIVSPWVTHNLVHYKDRTQDSNGDSHEDDTHKGGTERTIKDKETAKETAIKFLGDKMTGFFSSAIGTHSSEKAMTDTKREQTTTQTTDGKSHTSNDEVDTSHRVETDGGASARHLENQSTTTHLEYEVESTLTTTRPTLEASIIDGDGEVASSTFGTQDKK